MKTKEIQFTDRYQALGIPYPEKETCCSGQCKGVGFVPIYMSKNVKIKKNHCCSEDEKDPRFVALWKEAHQFYRLKMIYSSFLFWKEKPWKISRLTGMWERFDGYHFVVCPYCGGTGKKSAPYVISGGKNGRRAE